MAVCQNCHANNSDGATFCSNCGARLPPVYMMAQPAQTGTPKQGLAQHNGKAVASLVLGIIGLFAWIIPLVGFPVTIVGIVMGGIGMKSQHPGMAIGGLVMSIIGLIATVINAFLGALMAIQA